MFTDPLRCRVLTKRLLKMRLAARRWRGCAAPGLAAPGLDEGGLAERGRAHGLAHGLAHRLALGLWLAGAALAVSAAAAPGASAPTAPSTAPVPAATALPTVAALQRLLQATPRSSIAFEETRESPWLVVPAQSRGTLHALPDRLEKRMTQPRVETWTMTADALQWSDASGQIRSVRLADVPATVPLVRALRLAVAGDLRALEKDYRIQVSGELDNWSAELRPRGGEAARVIDHLILQGRGGNLLLIILTDRKSERTTTRLLP